MMTIIGRRERCEDGRVNLQYGPSAAEVVKVAETARHEMPAKRRSLFDRVVRCATDIRSYERVLIEQQR
jgi:hypothetical protein